MDKLNKDVKFGILCKKSNVCEECQICYNILSPDGYKLPCNHRFDKDCLEKWCKIYPGDRVIDSKYKCPICRKQTIPDYLNNINIENFNFEKYVYVLCKNCQKPFIAGPKSCEDKQLSDRCDECKINGDEFITCPNCGILLQHSGGCNSFICCFYSYDDCKRTDCDHGSNEFMKFCGHKFTIENKYMICPHCEEQDCDCERCSNCGGYDNYCDCERCSHCEKYDCVCEYSENKSGQRLFESSMFRSNHSQSNINTKKICKYPGCNIYSQQSVLCFRHLSLI